MESKFNFMTIGNKRIYNRRKRLQQSKDTPTICMKKLFYTKNKMTIFLGVKTMNVNRVKQILSSTAEIEVKYNGTSIWIDQLNEDGKTVTVHLRGPLEERTIVEIGELLED